MRTPVRFRAIMLGDILVNIDSENETTSFQMGML